MISYTFYAKPDVFCSILGKCQLSQYDPSFPDVC